MTNIKQHDSALPISEDPRDRIALNDLREYLAAVESYAAKAREIISSTLEAGFQVQQKADRSLVTEADVEVERALRDIIAERYPLHGILGEEFEALHPDADFQWIIDPVDGTEAFANGIPTYGSVISLYYQHLPLVAAIDNPALNLRLRGGFGLGVTCNNNPLAPLEPAGPKEAKTLRMIISKRKNFSYYGDDDSVFEGITKAFPNILTFDSCYAYTALLHGAADVLVDFNVKLWDVSAVLALAPELGGSYRVLSEQLRQDGTTTLSVVVGRSDAVERIASMLQKLLIDSRG